MKTLPNLKRTICDSVGELQFGNLLNVCMYSLLCSFKQKQLRQFFSYKKNSYFLSQIAKWKFNPKKYILNSLNYSSGVQLQQEKEFTHKQGKKTV